jgi:hypothetical protein
MKLPPALVPLCLAALPLNAQRTPPDSSATRSLPGIVALGERESCPTRDDAAARAVWERMRTRESGTLDGASLWTTMTVSSGWVDRSHLFHFDTLASNRPDGTIEGWNVSDVRRDARHALLSFYHVPRVGSGRRGMSGVMRATLENGIERHGYAELNAGINADLTQVSEAWTYPPLDAELASYFASPGFASRIALRFERRAPLTLGFCTTARFRAAPWVSGILTLRADTTLERAQWQFHTAKPAEEAGGDVWFGPGTLEPTVGIFYRRNSSDRYFQRRMIFDRWWSTDAQLLPDSLAAAPSRVAGPRAR